MNRPVRQGAPWTYDDHVAFIEALRNGLDDVETANALARTPSAIRQRARMLVDPGTRGKGEYTIYTLRRALAEDEAYDWEPRVRRAAAANGAHYWSREDTEALHNAWADETPLPELADRLGTTEQQVVRQLIALEIADSTPDITARLGCTAGGVVDLRSRLATDRAAAQVWVLTITALDVTRVSLHVTREDAETMRDQEIKAVAQEAIGAGPTTGTGVTTVTWCIAHRVPGEGNSGGEPDTGDQLVNS